MGPRLTREEDVLVLDMAGIGKTAFQDALAKVKAIEGRRFDGERKVWVFRAEPMVAHRLIHTVAAQPSAEVLEWVRQEMARQADEVVTTIPDAGVEDLLYGRRAALYPHQRAAVAYLREHPRSILADDMGLGKTATAIATVEELEAAGRLDHLLPKLVVAPASLTGNWAKELRTWAAPDTPVFIVEGRKTAPKRRALLEEAIATPGAWIIVNYEQVRAQKVPTGRPKPKYQWQLKEPLFRSTVWGAVIADEAHRIKNRFAQQTRGLWQIAHGAEVALLLTGTPVLNSPDELWPLLVALQPEAYGEYSPYKTGYQQFYDNYVEASEGYYGKIVTGVRNADALRFELSDKLVRRTKGQVLDLPPKVRTTIPVALSPKQRKAYTEAESGLWVVIEQAYDEADAEKRAAIEAALGAGNVQALAILIPNAAARVTRLRQIASSPALLGGADDSAKLDAVVEIVQDNPGKPFVTFSQFKGTASLIAERLGRKKLRTAVLTGDTPPEVRTQLVERFQAGDLDVLACTIGAGGVGITLTAGDTAIFTERDWTPALNEQAEDRLHRIGQDSRVNIIILEAVDTVDDGRVRPKNITKSLIMASVVQQDAVAEIRKEA